MKSMNTTGKKINVGNATSLVDLKAELVRKQNELRQERLQRKEGEKGPIKRSTNKKPSIWSKQNKGVLERSHADLEAKLENDNLMDKSRSSLEAKARLYEKMTSGREIPEEDGSDGYLVDFQGKAINSALEQRQRQRRDEEEAARKEEEEERAEVERRLEEAVPVPRDPEEEWVDYTDSVGRSRRCLKRDLEHHKKQDLRDSAKDKRLPDLMSADMHRELLRDKWEAEEEEMAQKPAGPVHYSNVRFDEVRQHGVGYYEFSKDEAERQEQMETLRQLREKTKEQQEKKESLKAKRKAVMKARLAKVKQRRMIQTGVELPEDSDSDEDDMIGPKLKEAKEPELLTRDDNLRKEAPVREWDKGKKEVKSYEDKLREERNPDFAPPTALYTEPTPPSRKAANVAAWREERQASIEKGVKARQARKTTNFERLDQLIGDKISNLRSEMEAQQNDKQQSNKPDINSRTDTELSSSSLRSSQRLVDNSEYSEAKSQWIPPDMSIPPPDVYMTPDMAFPPTLLPDTSMPPPSLPNPAMPPPSLPNPAMHPPSFLNPSMPPPGMQAPTIGYNVCDKTSASNPSLSDIDFSQPPPPPPPELAATPEASEPPQAAPLYARPNDPHMKPRTFTAASSAVISAPPKLLSAKPVFYQKGGPDPQELVHQAPRHERVRLHEVPLSLPVPPQEGHSMEYPSQEQVHGPHQREQASIHAWQRQYDSHRPGQQAGVASNVEALKPDNIPFVSPFVQRKEDLVKSSESKPSDQQDSG